MTRTLIKLKEVMVISHLSRSSIYDYIKKGRFPKWANLGASSYWVKEQVEEWLENQLVEQGVIKKDGALNELDKD